MIEFIRGDLESVRKPLAKINVLLLLRKEREVFETSAFGRAGETMVTTIFETCLTAQRRSKSLQLRFKGPQIVVNLKAFDLAILVEPLDGLLGKL